MPLSLQEYQEYWQTGRWEYENVTQESCIFFETGDTPMAEGLYALPDFGHVICFYRYFRAPEHKLTNNTLRVKWTETEQALDVLLVEFVKQGHRPEMSDRLREIVDDSLIGFWIDKIFILPTDLDAALSFAGNPLIDYDAYENEKEAETSAPLFDLNNPEHCKALKERIQEFGT